MPFKWTPEAETMLLIGAIKHCDAKPSSEYFESIATALGGETNANACSQRFYKLKREAEATLAKSSATPSAPSTPASNKKPGSTTKKNPASSGRKRKAADEDSETPNMPSTPSKKTMKIKGEAKTEVEGSDDEPAPTNDANAALEEDAQSEI